MGVCATGGVQEALPLNHQTIPPPPPLSLPLEISRWASEGRGWIFLPLPLHYPAPIATPVILFFLVFFFWKHFTINDMVFEKLLIWSLFRKYSPWYLKSFGPFSAIWGAVWFWPPPSPRPSPCMTTTEGVPRVFAFFECLDSHKLSSDGVGRTQHHLMISFNGSV